MSGVAPKAAAKIAVVTASAATSNRSKSSSAPPSHGGQLVSGGSGENDGRENKAEGTQYSSPLPSADDPVALLTYQNHRLVQSIRQRQEEIVELRQRWEGIQKEIAERRASTAVMRENWANLEENLRCISMRVAATATDDEMKERVRQILEPDTAFAAGRDVLEEGLTADSRKELEGEVRKRQKQISSLLENVLTTVLANEDRAFKFMQSIESLTTDEMHQKINDEIKKMKKEYGQLESSLDNMQKRQSKFSGEVEILKAALSKSKTTEIACRDNLEDAEYKIETMERKIVSLRAALYEALNKGATYNYLDAISEDSHAELPRSDARIESILSSEKKREIGDGASLPHEHKPTKKIRLDEQSLKATNDLDWKNKVDPELHELKQDNRRLKETIEKIELDLQYELKTRASIEERIDSLKVQTKSLEEENLSTRREKTSLELRCKQLEASNTLIDKLKIDNEALTKRTEQTEYLLQESREREEESRFQCQVLDAKTSGGAGMPESKTCTEIESIFEINRKEKQRLKNEISRLKSVISSQEKLDDQIRRQAAKATMLENRSAEPDLENSVSQIEALKAKGQEVNQKCEEMELFVELIRAHLLNSESQDLDGIVRQFREGKYGNGVNGSDHSLINGISDGKNSVLETQTMVHDLELKIKQLQEQFSNKEGECSVYLLEVEELGAAYEDLKIQNERLLLQIKEKEEYATRLLTESIRIEQSQRKAELNLSELQQKFEEVEQQITDFNVQYDHLRENLDNQILETTALDEKHLSNIERLEEEKSAKSVAEEESRRQKKSIEVLEGQLKEIREKHAVEREEWDAERDKIRQDAARKVAQAGGLKSPKASSFNAEMEELRSMVKCKVCYDRFKDTIIIRCCHMFCKSCVEQNLKDRHRKCPACGIPFGQADVRSIYLSS